MFEAINAVYLAAMLLSSIMLAPEGETLVPLEKDAYVQLSLYREWWREDGRGKCDYKGVLVPYTRTWPEEVQRGGDTVILPPEPDKIAGYVIVVNRKECKDKASEPILRAGLPTVRKYLFRGEALVDKTSHFQAGDILEASADKIPPWFPQVIERMELLAQRDEGAKSFLAASAKELDKVLPGRTAKATQEPTAATVDGQTLAPTTPNAGAQVQQAEK
ncbi:hypothetical protein [Variovorax sp. YR216]|uniref:hypothetical protein n=1 Tax=Variovorax sp. YR216 TaxID=1882828 RepID=UPI00089A6308|nr:hypothetical protein [Variovorax sp. YR216]SEB23545.1 hypothetical protein SAMN05444680_11853 [Variovorax sp. YR216]